MNQAGEDLFIYSENQQPFSDPPRIPAFPFLSVFLAVVSIFCSLLCLAIDQSRFSLAGYFIALFLAVPSLGFFRQRLKKRQALGGSISARVLYAATFGMTVAFLVCMGNAIEFALAMSTA